MCSRKCSSFTYEYACFYIVDGMCCHLSPPLSLSLPLFISATHYAWLCIFYSIHICTPGCNHLRPVPSQAAAARRGPALVSAAARRRSRRQRLGIEGARVALISSQTARYGTSVMRVAALHASLGRLGAGKELLGRRGPQLTALPLRRGREVAAPQRAQVPDRVLRGHVWGWRRAAGGGGRRRGRAAGRPPGADGLAGPAVLAPHLQQERDGRPVSELSIQHTDHRTETGRLASELVLPPSHRQRRPQTHQLSSSRTSAVSLSAV